jgi:hypothetical protein
MRNLRTAVPDHREVAKGTLRALIPEAGITVEQVAALLRASSQPNQALDIARRCRARAARVAPEPTPAKRGGYT